MTCSKSFAMVRAMVFLLVAAPLVTKSAHADDVSDFYFQQVVERYFEYPQNARTFGMAGSSVVTSSDSSSVLGNPAGLGLMKGGEVSFGYGYNRISGNEFPTGNGIEQTGNMGSGILALPIVPTSDGLPDYGNFGIAWSGYDTDWDDDSYNSGTERTQVVAAYSYGISENLSFGYSLGWTDDKLQAIDVFNYPMGDGFRHTLGTLYHVSDAFTFGSDIFFGHGTHHALFGPGIEGDSKNFQFGLDVGGSYQLTDYTTLALSTSYSHLSTDGEVVSSLPENIVGGDENGNLFHIRAGVEHAVTDWFMARAGYRFAGLASYRYNRVELNDLNGSAYYNAWSLGAGFVIPVGGHYVKQVSLDYGVEYRAVGNNDWQHLVTVSVPFNLCRP